MRLIKLGLAAINPTVGAVESNTDRVLRYARAMAGDDVAVGCFPEQVIGGYPAEDLVQWPAFVAAQREQLDRFAEETAGLATVFVLGVVIGVGGQLFNCAAVVHGGRVLAVVPKEKLPTYDVFYEARTLSRGTQALSLSADGTQLGDFIFEFDFGTIAVEVCEDAWSPDGPMRRRCFSGAEIVVNVSASPYRIGVAANRGAMLATRSADNRAVLAYVNRVGAQDGLVFDGGAHVFQSGRAVLDAPRFREAWWSCVVDLDRTTRHRTENTTWRQDLEAFRAEQEPVDVVLSDAPTADATRLAYPAPAGGSFFLPPRETIEWNPRGEVLDDLYDALAVGVRDYAMKTGVFRRIGVALSGGRDSMLTLLVAWRALKLMEQEAVDPDAGALGMPLLEAFYMPSRFSGQTTRRAAEMICRELDVSLRVVSIDEAFEREVGATVEMLGGNQADEITRQNVQARIRAARMWNWANTAGALFLQSSDMSEKAVGYTTIGGDMEGALGVLSNVPKTVVTALLERIHDRFGFEAIELTLSTEPSPELARDQEAEAELMPYPILDACLQLYAGEKLSPDEVALALPSIFPEIPEAKLRVYAERFETLFTRSIFKWVQAPLSIHIGSLDLERERALQLPVVQRNEWGKG